MRSAFVFFMTAWSSASFLFLLLFFVSPKYTGYLIFFFFYRYFFHEVIKVSTSWAVFLLWGRVESPCFLYTGLYKTQHNWRQFLGWNNSFGMLQEECLTKQIYVKVQISIKCWLLTISTLSFRLSTTFLVR